LQQVHTIGHRLDGVFKIAAGLVGMAALHLHRAGKIESVGGAPIVVLDLDLCQMLVVYRLPCRDAIAEFHPVGLVLLRPAQVRKGDLVVLRSRRHGIAASKVLDSSKYTACWSNWRVSLFDFEHPVFAYRVAGAANPVFNLPVFLLGLGDADGDAALEIDRIRAAG
jgi:hypothetical protein